LYENLSITTSLDLILHIILSSHVISDRYNFFYTLTVQNGADFK